MKTGDRRVFFPCSISFLHLYSCDRLRAENPQIILFCQLLFTSLCLLALACSSSL